MTDELSKIIDAAVKEFDDRFHKMTAEWNDEKQAYIWPQKEVGDFLRTKLTEVASTAERQQIVKDERLFQILERNASAAEREEILAALQRLIWQSGSNDYNNGYFAAYDAIRTLITSRSPQHEGCLCGHRGSTGHFEDCFLFKADTTN
jgi:hypothetical protein